MPVRRAVPIIKVTNLEAALAFYQARLGFVVDFHFRASDRGPDYVCLLLDDQPVHLSTFSGDGVLGTATYFYVDDVDALWRGFLARGFVPPDKEDSPVERGPLDQTWGMREFYVRDPDGNALRFGSPSGGDKGGT